MVTLVPVWLPVIQTYFGTVSPLFGFQWFLEAASNHVVLIQLFLQM